MGRRQLHDGAANDVLRRSNSGSFLTNAHREHLPIIFAESEIASDSSLITHHSSLITSKQDSLHPRHQRDRLVEQDVVMRVRDGEGAVAVLQMLDDCVGELA